MKALLASLGQRLAGVAARGKGVGALAGLRLHRPGRLLVFETTGTMLYGVVASCSLTGVFSIGQPVASRAVDFRGAIGEVLDGLRRAHKGRLPRQAVLITPSAASKLLFLPVDPRKQGKAQMGELVRYDLEELLMQQNEIWSLGGLLMGRGYLSPEQRRAMEDSADRRGRPGAGAYKGSVSDEQLQECQDLQAQLGADNEDLFIGHVPQRADEEAEIFPWWGVGVGVGIRGRWAAAFAKHHIFLAWIYPQAGAAIPLLDQETRNWLLVDVRQEQFGLFQGRGGALNALALHPCHAGQADPEAVAVAVETMLQQVTATIVLSAPAERQESLLAELGRRFQQQVLVLPAEAPAEGSDCPGELYASLQGVARHAVGLSPAATLVRVAAQLPAPPLWRRKGLYPWVAIVLLLLAITANEWSMRSRARQNEWALELADIEYNKGLQLKQQAQTMASEAKRLQDVLAAKEKELQERERLRDTLNNVIRYRQDLVPGVLQAIGQSMNDGVVLDTLEEKDDRSGFYLEGWAVKDADGQLFANRLNEHLAAWGYRVGNVQLAQGPGRLGTAGFVMKVWLVKAAQGEKKNA